MYQVSISVDLAVAFTLRIHRHGRLDSLCLFLFSVDNQSQCIGMGSKYSNSTLLQQLSSCMWQGQLLKSNYAGKDYDQIDAMGSAG